MELRKYWLVSCCVLLAIWQIGGLSADDGGERRSKARAYVAGSIVFVSQDVAVPQPTPNPRPNPRPNPEPPDNDPACQCDGSGYVNIQDGRNVRRVRCPCLDNCSCHRGSGAKPVAATAGSRKRIRLITDPPSCPPCREVERQSLPVLRGAGWKVGTAVSDTLQVVPADGSNAAVLPSFELVDVASDGTERVLRTETGYLSFVGIGELLRDQPISQQGRMLDITWSGRVEQLGRPSRQAVKATSGSLKLGPPYYALVGRNMQQTSVSYLMQYTFAFHGPYTWAELQPYANDQDKLNRIHGFAVTGQEQP